MSEPNDVGEELVQTQQMLEQILEVMPDDLFTLRALYETFLKLESPKEALDVLMRLDDAARSSQNGEFVRFVIEQYSMVVDAVPQVRQRIERLEELQCVGDVLVAEEEEEEEEEKEEAPAVEGRAAQKPKEIDAEMSLAWDLLQDGLLSEEEYSDVLRDLTEMSSDGMGIPVTVLHILSDRNFSRFERLLSHLCQKADTPIISISQFEENEDLYRRLPLEFVSHNGAMPFAVVGGDLLLGVLNPFDKGLVKRAEAESGRRCHPYLVTPQEYDQRLALMKKAAAA